MVQEVGVEVSLHHFHSLEARMYLLEQPLADLIIGSQCLVVLSSQTSEPPEIFSEVGFQQHFPKPLGNSSEPPEFALLQNQ
jgi:hypothetical protein